MSWNPEHLSRPHVTLVTIRHSGTHLIFPIVKALTELPVVEPGKLPFLNHQPNGQVITFWRDPRDRIVARWRWALRRAGRSIDPPDNFGHDEAIADMLGRIDRRKQRNPPEYAGRTMVQSTVLFVRHWTAAGLGLVVRFEELAASETGPVETARIARRLGSGLDPDVVFRSVFRTGPTYTGSFSRWREWFGPRSMEAFHATGGRTLLSLMGYEP